VPIMVNVSIINKITPKPVARRIFMVICFPVLFGAILYWLIITQRNSLSGMTYKTNLLF
jgi:hypothetical protein